MNRESETATPTNYITDDIDLSAALWIEVGEKPTVKPGKHLVEFYFKNTDSVRTAVCEYFAGKLFQDVRRYASNRSQLFRLLREVKQTGGVR